MYRFSLKFVTFSGLSKPCPQGRGGEGRGGQGRTGKCRGGQDRSGHGRAGQRGGGEGRANFTAGILRRELASIQYIRHAVYSHKQSHNAALGLETLVLQMKNSEQV